MRLLIVFVSIISLQTGRSNAEPSSYVDKNDFKELEKKVENVNKQLDKQKFDKKSILEIIEISENKLMLLTERVSQLESNAIADRAQIQALEGRISTCQASQNRLQVDLGELRSSLVSMMSSNVTALMVEVKARAKGCRVCFIEVEGSSQCQGSRNTCSAYSTLINQGGSWTDGFRDDTDGRSGGCNYKWKIDCIF